jgi:hypothetical protein
LEHFYRAQHKLSSLHKIGWRPAGKNRPFFQHALSRSRFLCHTHIDLSIGGISNGIDCTSDVGLIDYVCRTMPNLVVLHSLVSESASASRTEDPGFESPPGCKVFRSLYTAVPLSKLNMHCSVYLRKNKCFKKVCYKTLVFGGSQPIFAALVTALASSSYLPCCCMFRRTNSIRESYLCTICDL